MRIALALISLALAAPASAAEVGQLSWIVGTWRWDSGGGGTVTEAWQAPVGGAMSGVTTTERPGKPAAIEPMKISAEPAGLTFTAMPADEPPTPFVLLPGKPGEAVFENKAHDFPQRVIYRRCGADLCARIEGMLNGKLESQDWRYTRIK
jgi:hypothetical protein